MQSYKTLSSMNLRFLSELGTQESAAHRATTNGVWVWASEQLKKEGPLLADKGSELHVPESLGSRVNYISQRGIATVPAPPLLYLLGVPGSCSWREQPPGLRLAQAAPRASPDPKLLSGCGNSGASHLQPTELQRPR